MNKEYLKQYIDRVSNFRLLTIGDTGEFYKIIRCGEKDKDKPIDRFEIIFPWQKDLK